MVAAPPAEPQDSVTMVKALEQRMDTEFSSIKTAIRAGFSQLSSGASVSTAAAAAAEPKKSKSKKHRRHRSPSPASSSGSESSSGSSSSSSEEEEETSSKSSKKKKSKKKGKYDMSKYLDNDDPLDSYEHLILANVRMALNFTRRRGT